MDKTGRCNLHVNNFTYKIQLEYQQANANKAKWIKQA